MTAPPPRTERLQAELPDVSRHLGFVTALYADPAVAQWHWPGVLGGPRTPEQSRAMLMGSLSAFGDHGFGTWIWRDTASGELVGRVGITRSRIEDGREVVEVGWSVPVAHQGRGYATEAAIASVGFGIVECGLSEIVSFTMVENTASQRVMQKAGLTYSRDFIHAGLPHVLYATGQPTMTNTRNAA